MKQERTITLEGRNLESQTTIRTGPLTLDQALRLIDEYLTPYGWNPVFHPAVTAPKHERNVFVRVVSAGRFPTPVHGQALFRQLRDAVRAAECDDPADPDEYETERMAALLTHLEPHRPMTLYSGPEDCLNADCEHPTGTCELEGAAMFCAYCSAVHLTGHETGPEFIAACQVPWPCEPLRVAARYFTIDLGPFMVIPREPVPPAEQHPGQQVLDLDSNPNRCPTCKSPSPTLHPATAAEGEVAVTCQDPFHTVARHG
jgi:hypothetical protein